MGRGSAAAVGLVQIALSHSTSWSRAKVKKTPADTLQGGVARSSMRPVAM